MDEQELERQLRAGPDEGPPASFGVRDVLTRSAAAQRARRRAVLATCSCAVVVLAGLGLAGGLLGTSSGSDTHAVRSAEGPRAGAPSPSVEQPARPGGRPLSTGSVEGFPTESPEQGGGPVGKGGPRAESTSGCDKVDRELATALAGELPGTGSPRPAVFCPAGARAASIGTSDGLVSATLVRPGPVPAVPPRAGSTQARAETAQGATVVVVYVPAVSGSPPDSPHEDVYRIADVLAGRF